jgi:iron complex outermembrane receptor protein
VELLRIASILLLVITLQLYAQRPAISKGEPVEDLSVEEILGLQVTSVGRKAQQVANAPSAVYVITQEEIRRSGATTIPDILRIVPGLVVARINGNNWGISSRGGTRQFANKMQVMIDGRPVYNRLFSGVYWDSQDLIIEDIDRIEVVRGTGSVMWGSNAVNGVIHIITKASQDTLGSQATFGTGNEERAFSSYRFGGKVGEKLFYRIWGKQNYRRFYAPGSPLIRRNLVEAVGQPRNFNDGSSDDQDGSALRMGFRLDWQKSARDIVQVSGMMFRNSLSLESWQLSAGAVPSRLRLEEEVPGGNVLARWVRSNSSSAETSVQFWADRSSRESQLYSLRMDALDLELQHRRQLSESNEIHFGAGYRLTTDNLSSLQAFRFREQRRSDSLSNLMVRDEHQWFSRRVTVSAGIRMEQNTYTGFEWQPAFKFLYTPTKSHSFWAGWSRAVRTPSRAERDMATLSFGRSELQGLPVLIDLVGNQNLQAERVKEWSGGYRYQQRQKWSIDLNLFHNRLTRLTSLELGERSLEFSPSLLLRQLVSTGNGREGTSRGFEFAGSASLKSWWKIHGSHSYLSNFSRAVATSLDPARYTNGEEPRHQFKMRSLWNLSQHWQFDVSGYAIDRIPTYQVPGHVRIDSRLGWRPTRSHELSFTVQDWLNQRRLEFQSELYIYAVPVQRSMILRWTTRF